MKNLILILAFLTCITGYSQSNERVSTLEFVKIVGDNRAEAMYYYENNWKPLRELAVQRGYIESFQLVENTGDDTSFDLVLVTNYSSHAQYDQHESRFDELMRTRGDVALLNDKQPDDFRSIVRSEKMQRHF